MLLRRLGIAALALAGLLFVLTPRVWGQGAYSEDVIKALLLERIVTFLVWGKPLASDAPLDVAVLGADGIGNELARLFADKPFAGRALRVRHIESTPQIGNAQIVIIGRAYAGEVLAILESCNREGVLTVGDAPGLGEKGVAINFVREGTRIRFELRPSTLKQVRIQASYKLISLARVVGEP